MPSEPCATCYGTGELVTENGPTTCPACFGDGHAGKLEWRLREIERRPGFDADGDLRWLVQQLRRSRELLVLILARCQDADAEDEVARDVARLANEALGLYAPEPADESFLP